MKRKRKSRTNISIGLGLSSRGFSEKINNYVKKIKKKKSAK